MARVIVSRRGAERVRAGHPWIYRADVVGAEAQPGELVEVVDVKGRRLGEALFSDRSQITLRFVAWGDERFERVGWRGRIEAAAAYRRSLDLDGTAYRVVHGEADLLPSLVVDRYGDYLVVQALSQGTARHLGEIVEALAAALSPAGILARHDSKVRDLEGLPRTVEVLHGEVPSRVEVVEAGLRFTVDPWHGQKTGLFLDQRENHAAAARYATGRALDCFSYHGGFALHLARRGDHVDAVDVSDEACGHLRENARLNALANIDARVANVFDDLRELDRAGERFDTIVLDPPAFAKTKAALPKALAGYKEINLRALKLLKPAGVLVTCTCSYHVDEATFGSVVLGAALDVGVPVVVIEKRMQGRDHPILLGVPETYYLKCLVLRRVA